MRANPPKPDMVSCPNCGSRNEADRPSCRNCHKPMSALPKLYTTRDLAERYGCKPRAVARMAFLGRWPSRMVLGEYRFTPEMVEWIDSQHERWPNEQTPAPQQPKPKAEPVRQTRQRRTPQPPPPPIETGNVRRLVAKPRPNRIGRSA